MMDAPRELHPARPPDDEKFRAAAEYAIMGDLRYLSHHDELRLLTRALIRARWPLAYSQGFNPRPQLTLPLPRSTGTASDCQWLIVVLSEPRQPEFLFHSLATTVPRGCELQRVVAPAPAAMPHAKNATYEIELSAAEAERIRPLVARLLETETLVVERAAGPKHPAQPIDIRPYIHNIDLAGPRLRLSLHVANQRSARPSEILTEFGLAPDACAHRLRRVAVEWDLELTGPTFAPSPHERNFSGEQEYSRQENESYA